MRGKFYNFAVGALGLFFLLTYGCGGLGQKVLSTQARVVVETRPVRFDLYEQEHNRCLEKSADLEAYKGCMSLARHVARAADSYAEALLAAQRAYDIKGKDSFLEILPCVVASAGKLVDALKAANVPVPSAVSEVAALVGEYGDKCNG